MNKIFFEPNKVLLTTKRESVVILDRAPVLKTSSKPIAIGSLPASAWKSRLLRFGEDTQVEDPESVETHEEPAEDLPIPADTLPDEIKRAISKAHSREPVVLTVGHLLLEILANNTDGPILETLLKDKLRISPRAFFQELNTRITAIDRANESQIGRATNTSSDRQQAHLDRSLLQILSVLKTIQDDSPENSPLKKQLTLKVFLQAVLTEPANESGALMTGLMQPAV